MDIKEFQQRVNDLIKGFDNKFNCEHNVNATFIHLVEEVGEIANELNKPNIRNKELKKEELAEELVDTLVFTTHLANLHDIDLEKAIEEKLNKLKERWGIK